MFFAESVLSHLNLTLGLEFLTLGNDEYANDHLEKLQNAHKRIDQRCAERSIEIGTDPAHLAFFPDYGLPNLCNNVYV
jgi:hypothetical protein